MLPDGCYLYFPPPPNTLPHSNHRFSSHGNQIFEWENDGDTLYYDNHETVRFRIEAEHWFDQAPLGPTEKDEDNVKKSPYTIEASMEDPGLGPCLWWDDADGDEEMEG